MVGGSIPLEGGVLLDLTNLASTIEVDETSLLVTVDAGVFGPELEDRLRQTGSGYTLGHWPQSFNLATVGGWLACRGAGQYSNRYGKIEDIVRGLTVVLASGDVIFSATGVTNGSFCEMPPDRVCIPARRPPAWIFATTSFRPCSPCGKRSFRGA